MAFSYSGDPSNSDLDQVRFIIGDTEQDDYYLEDKEIQFFIDNESSLIDASIRSAEAISAQLSGKADSVDSEEISAEFRDLANRYWKLASRLEDRKSKEGSGLASLSTGDTLFKDGRDQIFSVGFQDNEDRF